jgi:glycine/D-amino acid oxidase-like deaminating enzyme
MEQLCFVAKTIALVLIVSAISCVCCMCIGVTVFTFLNTYSMLLSTVEVYPRPDGTIYICGIGGSDYISKEELQAGAFREECDAKEARVQAASLSFQEMSDFYKKNGELDRVQACMRPCPPDALPYMGRVPGYEGAFINAGHNCW